jgi:hypothetical protein
MSERAIGLLLLLALTVGHSAPAVPAPTDAARTAAGQAAVKPARGNLSLSGAWALYPLAVRWQEEFQKSHPGVNIDVQAGGAGKGIADALAGVVDIGMVSREINPAEVERRSRSGCRPVFPRSTSSPSSRPSITARSRPTFCERRSSRSPSSPDGPGPVRSGHFVRGSQR